jgi:polygalacturonase
MIRYAVLLTLVFLQVGHCMAGKPKKPLNILKMGAIADGTTLNTQIIQKAIDDVSEKGGGTVYFPMGRFVTGSLMMKSNVTLELAEGAVLLGSTNPYDYFLTKQSSELTNAERNDKSSLALILAEDVHNISLIGKGTIDGQGLELALNIDSLHHAGVLVDPNYNYRRMRPNEPAGQNCSDFRNVTA